MKNEIIIKTFAIILVAFFVGCSGSKVEDKPVRVLPILGFHDTELIEVDGQERIDTIFYTVPKFYFTAHTGEGISDETVKGHIYVADFFFTHCPTICPVMIKNLETFHERTKDIEELMIISHTIDPERDSIGRLNEYIETNAIDTRDDWFFVRGSQAYTYDIGKNGYLVNADIDPAAEGGFLHSEHFVLIDRTGHIRGYYEGTDPEAVEQLEADIRRLIKEEYGE